MCLVAEDPLILFITSIHKDKQDEPHENISSEQ